MKVGEEAEPTGMITQRNAAEHAHSLRAGGKDKRDDAESLKQLRLRRRMVNAFSLSYEDQ